MCLYPRLIKNKKYLPTKKNNYNPPICDDERKLYVPIRCGKCIECKKQIGREWKARLNEEIRNNNTGKFVTLTFTEENLQKLENEIEIKSKDEKIRENEIATLAVRRFLERWRKETKKSVKHWLITELGQNNTERIHLHGLIFTDKNNEYIAEKWKYGNIFVGEFVNEKTINYITKYCTKIDTKHKGYEAKILCSKGIGEGYLKRQDWKKNIYKKNETNETYTTRQGVKVNLPIYYRNKIYTEEEREKLWIEKLDKKERWILGERIDISENEEEYERKLEFAQRYNKELGFGDLTEEWSKEKYKKDRENLKRNKYFADIDKRLKGKL
jgi:hypothetical protein